VSTILGLLLLVGALLAIVMTARKTLPLASARTRVTKETPQERQDRVHRMEHDLGVVEKHEPWEQCRRCQRAADERSRLDHERRLFDLEALRRLERKAKEELNMIIQRDDVGWKIKRLEPYEDFYEIVDGTGRVVDAIHRIPPAEYMPNPSAPPEKSSR
jgi:hypothetical protein